MGALVWDLSLGILALGIFPWDLSLGDLSLGKLGLGGLGELPEKSWGNLGDRGLFAIFLRS